MTVWTIRSGPYEATVHEAGGGLGDLLHDGDVLVRGPAPGAPVSGGRGQVLLPWPNRLRDGRYQHAGTTLQLPLTEPATHNATHGLVRWLAWRPVMIGDDAVVLGTRLIPQPGYPWQLEVRASYTVDADGLSVRLSARNASASAAPFAVGMHPYLDVGCRVEKTTLTLPGRTRLLVDDRHLPVGTEAATGDHDFTLGRQVGDLALDDAFTDLEREADGSCLVRLEGERAVELRFDDAWSWVQAYTGDELAEGARETLAIEPMTAPPDAFNSGTDLINLDAGASWSGGFRISRAPTSAR